MLLAIFPPASINRLIRKKPHSFACHLISFKFSFILETVLLIEVSFSVLHPINKWSFIPHLVTILVLAYAMRLIRLEITFIYVASIHLSHLPWLYLIKLKYTYKLKVSSYFIPFSLFSPIHKFTFINSTRVFFSILSVAIQSSFLELALIDITVWVLSYSIAMRLTFFPLTLIIRFISIGCSSFPVR